MKYIFLLFAVLLLILPVFTSCAQPPESTGELMVTPSASVPSPDTGVLPNTPGAIPSSSDKSEAEESPEVSYPDTMTSGEEYSLNIGGVTLTLRENNLTDKLELLPIKNWKQKQPVNMTAAVQKSSPAHAGELLFILMFIVCS